jgi:hypothetical protein
MIRPITLGWSVSACLLLGSCSEGRLADDWAALSTDSPAYHCTEQGLSISAGDLAEDTSQLPYTISPSPVTCDGVPAVRLSWKQPTHDVIVVTVPAVDAANLRAAADGHLTIHLRGDGAGPVIVSVAFSNSEDLPTSDIYSLASNEGPAWNAATSNVSGTFDWTAFELSFPVSPAATSAEISIELYDTGTLDVADIEIGPGL